MIQQQPFGPTGHDSTRVIFGAAAIGNLYAPVEPDAAAAAVDAAWDAGIRTFDTAPHYGLGLSERRLGEALRSRPRDAYTLSTKAGRLLEPCPADGDDLDHGFAVPADHRRVWDFSADGVRRSIEEILVRALDGSLSAYYPLIGDDPLARWESEGGTTPEGRAEPRPWAVEVSR